MSAGKPGASLPTSIDRLAPCYGVMCPMRGDCERYVDTKAMSAAALVRGTCRTTGERVGFVLAAALRKKLVPVEAVAA